VCVCVLRRPDWCLCVLAAGGWRRRLLRPPTLCAVPACIRTSRSSTVRPFVMSVLDSCSLAAVVCCFTSRVSMFLARLSACLASGYLRHALRHSAASPDEAAHGPSGSVGAAAEDPTVTVRVAVRPRSSYPLPPDDVRQLASRMISVISEGLERDDDRGSGYGQWYARRRKHRRALAAWRHSGLCRCSAGVGFSRSTHPSTARSSQ
jgi:hypothetical protein